MRASGNWIVILFAVRTIPTLQLTRARARVSQDDHFSVLRLAIDGYAAPEFPQA
jgi:hypothetical protein